MSPELPHIDTEAGFRAIVEQALGLAAGHIGGWPESTDVVPLSQNLPYVSVGANGGDQDYFESTPIVDIDIFARTRAEAKSLASALTLHFLRYPQSVVVEGRFFMLDEATTTVPQDLPWEDPKIRRQSVTIQATVRR